MEKRLTANQDADDCCFPIIVYAESVAGKRLPSIKLALADGDPIVIFKTDGVVFTLVSIIEIEKIMPVKQLLLTVALVHQDQDLLVLRPGPTVHLFRLCAKRDIVIGPIQGQILRAKLIHRRVESILLHSSPPQYDENMRKVLGVNEAPVWKSV